jgi:Sec-independent protein secretion pathway component TatC
LPMCLLYESCIWITWFMRRKQRRKAIEDRHG